MAKKLFVMLEALADRVVSLSRAENKSGAFSLRRLLPIQAHGAHSLVPRSTCRFGSREVSSLGASHVCAIKAMVAREVCPAFLAGAQLNGGIILGAS